MQQRTGISILFPCFLAMCFVFAPFFVARAAVLKVGTEKDTAAFLLFADAPVNAIEGVVVVPSGVMLTEVSDEGTVVQFWIKRPKLSADGRTIAFAGIIPGGFSGEGMLFRVQGEGDLSLLSFDTTQTQLLANDGLATPQTIHVAPPILLPEVYRLSKERADGRSPLPFTPEIAVIPTEDGAYPHLLFATKDNETGIAHYEVAFSDTVTPDTSALKWFIAESPYRLPPEHYKYFIYIKAVDRAGNMHIEMLSPRTGGGAFAWIIFGILGIGGAMLIGLLLRRKLMAGGRQ